MAEQRANINRLKQRAKKREIVWKQKTRKLTSVSCATGVAVWGSRTLFSTVTADSASGTVTPAEDWIIWQKISQNWNRKVWRLINLQVELQNMKAYGGRKRLNVQMCFL